MRLLFSLGSGFPAIGYGGGHQVLRGIARSLTRLGHEVCVIVGGADEVGASAVDEGVAYRFQRLAPSRLRFARVAAATVRATREWHPDVVCCFTEEMGLVAPICRMLGVPVLACLDVPEVRDLSLSFDGIRNARWNLGQALMRPGCKLAAKTLTLTENTRRQAIDRWGLSAEQTVAVGMGLDEAYLGAPSSALNYTRSAPLRLLSVGRISLFNKPLDLVAEALSQTSVPWAHWTIIGSAEHDAVLRDRLSQLGLQDRVRMTGFMPPTAVAQELARHDVVLLPSRYESFFLAPYEAIACRRMVITNDVAQVKRSLGASPLLVLAREQTVTAYGEALSVVWQRLQAPTSPSDDLSEHVRALYSWDSVSTRLVEVALSVAPDRRPPAGWRSRRTPGTC